MNIRTLADGGNPESFSNRMRNRRFQIFEQLVGELPRPLRVLDVGGTNEFWESRGWHEREDVSITLLNITAPVKKWRNIDGIAGDATDLSRFGKEEFDAVFSNSVIEHLFTHERQRAMASEVARVGRCYWVQTPNFWFPMEPHFHVVGWHWAPESARVWLLRRRRCGWRGPCADPVAARELVREVRIMSARELRAAFPDGTLLHERFCGLTKSFVMARGFPGLARGIRL